MRVFAPTIRSLHVLALITFSSVTRLPHRYGMFAAHHDRLPLTRRARLIFDLLVNPITWHMFPRQIPGQAPISRHQRDLIRRRVRLLLTVLGDTPEAIGATLHRLNTVGDLPPAPEWHTPLEAYLYVRTGHEFDIGLLLTTVDDTFDVVTPTTIRNYIRTPCVSAPI